MKNLLILSAILMVISATPSTAATPGFDTLVNYDTSWTYVYDGGKSKTGLAISDIFYDVKCLTNGVCVCRCIR
jgi:hypothetical protein